MSIAPFADWRGPTPNKNVNGSVEQRGLVVHIAEGSYEGTISWCKNPDSNVSCHFVTAADGRIAQLVDTKDGAWTQINGNNHWISVENEGHTPNPLTDAQVTAIAKIFAWLHEVHGVPLQNNGSVVPLPGMPAGPGPNGHGLAHHSTGTTAEGWTGGTWGHSDCPGPAIQAQKPLIVQRAIEIAGGTFTQGEDMVFVHCVENGGFYVYGLGEPKWYKSQAAFNAAKAACGNPATADVDTCDHLRDTFGYIPGDSDLIAAGLADVLTDGHGNVRPSTAQGGGGSTPPAKYTVSLSGTLSGSMSGTATPSP